MIPVDELRRYIGLGPEDEVDDALLEQLEAEEVEKFQRETNRYFGPVATLVDTITISGRRYPYSAAYRDTGVRGPSLLRLRAPVVSLTSVEALAGSLISAGWSSPWALSAFEADGHTVALVDGTVFPFGTRVRVTYQGGYEEGEEPADVRGAIKERVLERYRGRVTATESRPATPYLPSPAANRVAQQWRRNPGV